MIAACRRCIPNNHRPVAAAEQREAASGCAAVANHVSDLCAGVSGKPRTAEIYDCYAAGRRLRQLLQSCRRAPKIIIPCSSCRAARGCVRLRSSRKSAFAVYQANRVSRNLRLLRSRTQASPAATKLPSPPKIIIPCSSCRAARGCVRLRSSRKSAFAVYQANRVNKTYDCYAAGRRLRQLLQSCRRPPK